MTRYFFKVTEDSRCQELVFISHVDAATEGDAYDQMEDRLSRECPYRFKLELLDSRRLDVRPVQGE